MFSDEKNPIFACFRSFRMPYTDKITEIAHYVRTMVPGSKVMIETLFHTTRCAFLRRFY